MPRFAVAKVMPFLELTNFFARNFQNFISRCLNGTSHGPVMDASKAAWNGGATAAGASMPDEGEITIENA